MNSKKKNLKYVFISSASRSGSTLLDLLLGSHSDIVSLGEISHLPKNISMNTLCSCGCPVQSCEFWKMAGEKIRKRLDIDIMKTPYALKLGFIKPSRIADRIHRTYRYRLTRKMVHGIDYLSQRFDLSLPKRLLSGHHREKTRHNLALYDSAADAAQKRIIADSTKSYLKPITLYSEKQNAVRIIMLTRDGRGVMYSNIKSKLPVTAGIREWKTYNRRNLFLIKKYVAQEHCLSVKYEDLTARPAHTLKLICNFLGLPFEKNMLDYAGHTHHITNGNDMRFQTRSIIMADLSWKNALSKSQLSFFEHQAGALNRELGYG